jgi:citrate synthase
MGLLIRGFAAACVATIIAQLIIVGIMAFKGNLHADTVTQALALVNGIDVTGSQLEKVVQKAQDQPVPTHDEVLRKRALLSQELQMKQDSLSRQEETIKKQWLDLKSQTVEFDRRRQDFYTKVEEIEKKLVDEGTKQMQATFEELAPDQAKEQLLLMLADERMDDVVALIKVTSPTKRKKILGEFIDKEDATNLHKVLMRMLDGEPASSLISDARDSLANP